MTGLSAGTTYYWRVYTNNGGNISVYSDVWNFYVSATGIEDHVAAEKIIVSPNPGNGRFVFSNLEKGNTIEILDIAGRIVLSTAANNSSFIIDLTGKEKGIYFYRVLNKNKGSQSGKLVIQ